MSSDLTEKELLEADEKRATIKPPSTKVEIKMNRKQRRAYGRARMPWSKQVDGFLCLLNHNKYVKKKEGMKQ